MDADLQSTTLLDPRLRFQTDVDRLSQQLLRVSAVVLMEMKKVGLCSRGCVRHAGANENISEEPLPERPAEPRHLPRQRARRSGRSFNLYKNLHPSRSREIKCFFTLVMSAQNDYLFWIIYPSARRNFLISPLFCLFCSAGDSKWLLVSRKPMDRRFHQSIRKHLPHTQHDLYLVNRIVSLYPYIMMALILLAVCLMLFLRLTSRSTEIEGGLVQYRPEYTASFLGML